METKRSIKPFAVMMIVYLVCYAFRMMELMVWRTDQGFAGEAFIHKLIGVGILVLAMRYAGYTFKDIGMGNRGSLRGILMGLAIGLGVFLVAYLVEYMMLAGAGQQPQMSFYVSAYALDGNVMGATTFATVAMCVLFNIVNVVMEEGIFRGLFIKLAQRKVSFMAANTVAAVLFGLWHVALPIRSFADGAMSAGGAAASGMMYVLTTFLMSFQMGMLKRMTGGLWAPMAAHFVNNTIVNLLHVTSAGGVDELQTLRITITQTVSFVGVLVAYIIWARKRKTAVENGNMSPEPVL